MATDATGTPSTNFSIPKYLTSADAPSGKGLNAIVDFIDTLLKKGFVQLTSTGDIVYASSANTASRLPIGSTGNVLTVAGGVPTWAAASLGLTGLTGVVTDTGSITRGSGFTITKLGTGSYRVNFTVSFVSAPTFVATIFDSSGAAEDGIAITALSTSSCTLETFNTNTRVAVDQGFNFIVVNTL